jgi:hypothetical protein
VVILDRAATDRHPGDRVPYRVPAGEPPPAPGDVLALDDGRVRLRVERVTGPRVRCRVEAGHAIPRFTGVITASGAGPHGRLTAEDRRLARTMARHVDYLCASFVDSPAIVEELTHTTAGSRCRVIAKVETPTGVAALADLVSAASGVMLARGDLSIFYTDDQMHHIAVTMTRLARQHGRLVILATNYFRGLTVAPFRLSEQECRTLDRVAALVPDYLLLNETAFSPNWEHIAATAVSYCQRWRDRI